jgi:rsbT co-antagonist protein RsbR
MSVETQEIVQLKEEVQELKRKLEEAEREITDISAPVIPSIVPETILIPIMGRLSQERFEAIITKILDVSYNQDINTIIVDFSGIRDKDMGETDVFGMNIHNMAQAVQLMGIEILFVGFTPSLTQIVIQSDVREVGQIKSFLSFKTALQYLMSEKSLSFQEK